MSGHSEVASREAPYRKVQSLMPDLIAEMSADLKSEPLVRELFLVGKGWVMNFQDHCFEYFFEEHDKLSNKFQILENCGFVQDVTSGNAKRYRLTENFVDYLLSL